MRVFKGEKNDLSRFIGWLWGRGLLVSVTALGKKNSGFHDSLWERKEVGDLRAEDQRPCFGSFQSPSVQNTQHANTPYLRGIIF
jgi:hypothetical protein